jgi:polyisoprenoid-binding protein YceI
MKILSPSLVASLAIAAGGAPAMPAHAQVAATVALDKSYIRFVTKQMNVPVEGRFRKFNANIAFDAKKPAATKAEFEVDLASIDLGNPDGDTEVQRKPWFNTDAFPRAKFVSGTVKALGGDRYEVAGPLTIKGIAQNVAIVASVKSDAAGVSVAEGQFPLKRLLFKIGEGQWADTDTVADEVEVRFRFVFSAEKK